MRRSAAALLATVVLFSACKTAGLSSKPVYNTPGTTTVFGDWVLDTPADSTAFVGAREVQMNLQTNSFMITAMYPTSAPVVIRGSVTPAPTGGMLTLTPESGTSMGSRGALAMTAGQSFSLVATASGNTLIFSAPTDKDPLPSSVWHKKKAAQAAGEIPRTP